MLANFPGRFAAGVSMFGVGDWVTALEVASPALKASDRIECGDITEQRWRDYYRVNSPVRQADKIDVHESCDVARANAFTPVLRYEDARALAAARSGLDGACNRG